MEWNGHVSYTRQTQSYKMLAEKPQCKRPMHG